MARKKFRNQRSESFTDRSFQEYLTAAPMPQTSRTELMALVRGGEDTFLELKVKLSNPEKITQGIVALANTGGGLLVIGVNDNLRVEGVDDAEEVRDELVRLCREEIVPALTPYIDIISFDNGRRVVTLDVEDPRRQKKTRHAENAQPPYRTRDGRYFIRIGAERREATREELSILLDEARPRNYESILAVGAKVEDVDEAHLWSFVREFEGDAYTGAPAGAGYPTGEVLERDLLLAVPTGLGPVPTVAGLLLFGHDDRVAELLPRTVVEAVRFAGDTPQSPKVESRTLYGNLHTLYEAMLRFVERYCDLWEKRPQRVVTVDAESPVAPRANYHSAAVREAIANALAHRDHALREQPTRLHIYDHAIEITNARRTGDFTPAMQRAIRYGVPQRLNPQLLAIFSSPAYGLTIPTGGLPMLLRESRLFAGRKTDVRLLNDEFRLRLHGV